MSEATLPSLAATRSRGPMDQDERNRLLNELRRLKLAAADMRLVVDAAEVLQDRYALMERVLETGLVTVYARSFNSSGRGWQRFKEKWTPTDPDELALHRAIIRRRNKSHAHTDERDSGREIVDIFGERTYAEEYDQLNLESVAKIAAIAHTLHARFEQAATEIEYKLGRVPG
jgi:hypothetical protein